MTTPQLKPGARLRSRVSEAEVIVVRVPSALVEIACGGTPMADSATPDPAPAQVPAGQVLLGKRYVDDELGLELLCVKPGAGVLSVSGRELTLKAAKSLPSSD